jgi:hypothetical protein
MPELRLYPGNSLAISRSWEALSGVEAARLTLAKAQQSLEGARP